MARLKIRQGSKVRRKREKVEEPAKLVSLPSYSDYLEYIKELGFKDNLFLGTATLPYVFLDYQTPTQLARFWEDMRKKTRATKPKPSTIETTSYSGDNMTKEEERPLSPLHEGEYRDCQRYHASL